MDLLEYQGKQLFARHGLRVSSGEPVTTVEDAVRAATAFRAPVFGKHLTESCHGVFIGLLHGAAFTGTLQFLAPVPGNPFPATPFHTRIDETVSRVVADEEALARIVDKWR